LHGVALYSQSQYLLTCPTVTALNLLKLLGLTQT